MKNCTDLKFTQIKSKNRRVEVVLWENNDTKDKFFTVFTKRLIDFKKREITQTHLQYSIETFCAIYESMNFILNDSETVNKLILSDLSKMSKGILITNLNNV